MTSLLISYNGFSMSKLSTCFLILGSLLAVIAAPTNHEARDVPTKATYNFPAFPSGFEDKIRPKFDGCVLVIQGPSAEEQPVCGKLHTFMRL